MKEDIQTYLEEEIITKECHDYRLISLGCFSSVAEAVERISGSIPVYKTEEIKTNYALFEAEVKRQLYKHIPYGRIIRDQKDHPILQQLLFRMKKREILNYKKNFKGDTIDDVLTVDSRNTLAFKLSHLLHKEQFIEESRQLEEFSLPQEILRYYQEVSRAYYPLDFEKMTRRLKSEDMEFWEELYPLLGELSSRILASVLQKEKSPIINTYKEEIWQETITESYLTMIRKTKDKLSNEIHSEQHLLHHTWNICKNKCREAIRRYDHAFEFVGIDSDQLENLPSETLHASQKDASVQNLLDLNAEDPYELSYALMEILLFEKEPFYDRLTCGIEEKVDLLIKRAREGKTYKEMVNETEGLSPREKAKRENKMRQDVVRVRKELLSRFREIVEQLQTTGSYGKM